MAKNRKQRDYDDDLDPLDVFADVEDAEVVGSGQWINPGKYVFEVKKLLIKRSSRDDSKVLFIAEFETIESDQDHTQPGTTRVEIINLSNKETGPGSVKAFAMALGEGVKDSDITKEAMRDLVSEEQPAAGVRVHCEAWTITTKKGNPFTKKRWEFHSESDEEDED